MGGVDLNGLKADWHLFHTVTGIDRPGAHHRSFLREEGRGSTSVWTDDAGRIFWKDHGTGAGGSLIDAAATLWGCTTAEAIRRLAGTAG